MTRRRIVAAAVACAVLVAVALVVILGGGDDKAAKPKIGASGTFKAKSSLIKKGDSAAVDGAAESYAPEGELIADSGFRPEVDGFAFENYGNDVPVRNLGPAQVEDLFGEQVCLSGTGEDCELVPAAKEWMDNQNEGMAGGHCQGFSVTALRMWNEDIDQEDFGASVTSDLEIVGNDPLQESIAEHFTYQFLPPIVAARVKGTPSEVLQTLVDALNSGDELYTLGVYKPDLSGGHAITPFAVEDKGDGKYAILVYDNNFPGVTRAVQVDTNNESWSYVSGTNPDDLGQVYEGDAETFTLELDPTKPGDTLQPCPFCDGSAASAGDSKGSKGSVLPEDQQYTEITLGGDPRNHPHLVFTDDQGKRTGVVGGRMLQEIPDVEVVKTYATQNWEGAPEPRFRLPEGSDYTISVDGTDLEKPAKTKVNLVGNGLVIEIEDIKIAPGQKDEMALPGGYGITYQPNGKGLAAPSFFAGLVEDEAAYNFAASAVGLKPGSTLSLLVDQKKKVVILDSTGSESIDGGNALFILQLTKAGADGKIAQWQNAELQLDGQKEEKAAFEYDQSPTPGKALPLLLFDKNADQTGTISLKAQ
ncbi:MAG: hypothetical protein QOJ57_2220 [Thermoleophilaceae bacterium]|nr:hypothetical protein [Thermoleophilaceae bacterium]